MSEAKYKKLKKWIKSKILDGTFKPNQKIYSESELMKQFNVSRHTVRVSLGELVSEGWLYKEQGSGTFVSERNNFHDDTVQRKNIAIITTYISDYIFPSIIRGAESIFRKENYQVSLFSTNNDHENEAKILETVISQRFDGIIVEPTRSATSNPNIKYYLNIESLGIPYVMINAYYDELEPIFVAVDDAKGAYIQTEHLIKLGHQDILGFFKTDDMQGVRRMKGYLKAHRDYGVPIKPSNIITYTTDEKNTKPSIILGNILENNLSMPTGIVCYNDELAMNLLNVLREKDLKTPEDISIVGFDDSFLSDISEVKLTTIKHPKSLLGEMAAKTILNMIKNNNEENSNKQKISPYIFEPILVKRNSTQRIN